MEVEEVVGQTFCRNRTCFLEQISLKTGNGVYEAWMGEDNNKGYTMKERRLLCRCSDVTLDRGPLPAKVYIGLGRDLY